MAVVAIGMNQVASGVATQSPLVLSVKNKHQMSRWSPVLSARSKFDLFEKPHIMWRSSLIFLVRCNLLSFCA
jgi:hypothetical protein